MSNKHFVSLIIACCALFTGCEPTDLVSNPSVDRWCGERPCGWEVEGKIDRVGTWNEDDYAVQLTGSDVRLSQLNAQVDTEISCFEFSMITKIDDAAEVYVELDFLDDGSAEFSRRLRKNDYEPVRFMIATPTWYEGVRFIVRKEGKGKAVLARMRVTESYACTGKPLPLLDRPVGAYCEESAECMNDMCDIGMCVQCRDGEDCEEGQACTVEPREEGTVYVCAEPGMTALGERCVDDAACGSGICCNNHCSECCDSGDCSKGKACKYPVGITLDEAPVLQLCEPGDMSRPKGAACTDDSDCASNHCTVTQTCLAEQSCDDECQLACLLFTTIEVGECD